MRFFVQPLVFAALAMLAQGAGAQVIEFESGGLKYQTLTNGGVTIMFAHLPATIRDYSILQVAVSNGSSETVTIRPQDFVIELSGGAQVRGTPPVSVIKEFIRGASGDDVIKMVTAYELGLYGFGKRRLTNAYEKRRQSALAVVSSKRLKAAAAASAIAFVETELRPGESTDGALFYRALEQDPDEIQVTVYAAGKVFDFEPSRKPADALVK